MVLMAGNTFPEKHTERINRISFTNPEQICSLREQSSDKPAQCKPDNRPRYQGAWWEKRVVKNSIHELRDVYE